MANFVEFRIGNSDNGGSKVSALMQYKTSADNKATAEYIQFDTEITPEIIEAAQLLVDYFRHLADFRKE